MISHSFAALTRQPRTQGLSGRACEGKSLGTRLLTREISNLVPNLVPRACDPREGTRGSGIIRCRKPGILAKIELRIPFQRPIRFLPETDYPRASRSFPRIAGSGNEIGYEVPRLFSLILGATVRYHVQHSK